MPNENIMEAAIIQQAMAVLSRAAAGPPIKADIMFIAQPVIITADIRDSLLIDLILHSIHHYPCRIFCIDLFQYILPMPINCSFLDI